MKKAKVFMEINKNWIKSFYTVKIFLFIILFKFSCLFLFAQQNDSWWETLKSYEKRLNKIAQDLEKEYQRAKYLKEVKEKRELETKKISKDYQKKAIEEITKFLKEEIGNAKGADFIKKKFESGSIVFGDEDSYILGTITIDKNHLLGLYDKEMKTNFHNLVKLTAVILHECIHSGQWGAFFGMTSDASEEEAYFGTLSAIALWMEQMEKKLEGKKSNDPCNALDAANKLSDIVNVLSYYDSIIYEKSTERKEETKKLKEKEGVELQFLYEKKAKAEKNLSLLELYHSFCQEGLSKSDLKENEKNNLFSKMKKIIEFKKGWSSILDETKKEISKKEELIKTYQKEIDEPTLDITKFKWKSQDGNTYNRDKLLKVAREKQNKIAQELNKLKNNCEEEKKKTPPTPDYAKNISPPPVNEKAKLYYCLCRCNIPMGVWGGYYPDPIPNSSPSCERSGICASGNWGCLRFYPPTEGDCFESCIKANSADPEKIKKEINAQIEKDYNDLIKKAREIMEEYLKGYIGVVFKSFYLNNGSNLFALNSQNYLSDTKVLYQLSPVKVENPYLKLVKEKNKRKDPETVLSLIKQAESIFPARKNSGETGNIRAEFAIILAKASLNIITELEFDECIYMLNKAIEMYNIGAKNRTSEELKNLLKSFEKWKSNWQTIEREVPNCLKKIKEQNVCECEELYKKIISPAFNSFVIYAHSSPDKWEISRAYGTARAIPKRDKLEKEIKESLEKSKAGCENNKILYTKEMKQLREYYNYKKLEMSKYIDKNDLQKSSRGVICGINALKLAEKIISSEGLCDCQRNELKEIIEIAKYDGKPLSIDFSASPSELKVGERTIIRLQVKNGRAPFEIEMKGSYKIGKERGEGRGFVVNWMPEKEGQHLFNVYVKDSCGEVQEKTVYVMAYPKEDKKIEKVKEIAGKKIEKDLTEKEKKSEIKDEKKVTDITKEKKEDKKEIDKIKEEKRTSDLIKEKKEDKKEIEKIKEEKILSDKIATEKELKKGKQKEEPPSKVIDLTGKWIANCGDEDIPATLSQSGNYLEFRVDDSFYSGNIKGTSINMESSDKMEKITGSIINNNNIDIKIVNMEYPQNPSNCKLKREGKRESVKEKSRSEKTVEIFAELENRSNNNVHIFIEGQDTFGPQNRLVPKEKRTLKFSPPKDGVFVKFIAGRNGQKIAECKWEYQTDSTKRIPVVIFDETNPFNKLSCSTGLR